MPDLVEYIWGNNVGDVWNNTLSVEEFNTKKIKLYPNPVTNQLFVSGKEEAYGLEIYSSEGRLLQSKILQNNTALQLDLSSGLYLARISAKGKTETQKFIVK